MKILLLSYYFSEGLEGTAIVFINIAELLAKNGHKVWVVTNKFEGVDYPKHNNLKIVFISSPKKYEKKRSTTIKDTTKYIFSSVKAGLAITKREKIDIIHSNSSIAGFAGSIISSFTSKKHILTIHNVYPHDYWKEWTKQPENSKFKAFLGKIQEKIAIKSRYTIIHTVSEFVKENLVKLGVKKQIVVIPNAIRSSKSYNVPIVPFQFVLISRLVFYKNVQIILKALKIVKKKFPQVSFIIIGDGPYRKTLEELVDNLQLENNVSFKGTVIDEVEKNKLIACSQALLHPSYYESFGLIILEAFSQKKPAIVSDLKPLSEIVEHKKTGLVVPPHNEKEWAKTLEYALSHPQDIAKMGERGRKVLEEHYNQDVFWKRISKMYQDVNNKWFLFLKKVENLWCGEIFSTTFMSVKSRL